MVVKMMRWPWPPLISRKYEVRLVVRRLDGWDPARDAAGKCDKMAVEIRWKGPRAGLSSLRRTVKRNFTKEVDGVVEDGGVLWDEEFVSLCTLSAYKENLFLPWEIVFTVFSGLSQGLKNKVTVLGTASLNLANYASAADQKEFELNVPLTFSCGTADSSPQLCVSLNFVELSTTQETSEPLQRALVPLASPAQSRETVTIEKDEVSAIKAGLRKVKIFTDYVSTRRAKKACHEEESSEGRCSTRSEDGEYPFDSDSIDESEEGESDEGKNSGMRKSFSYGTLAYANYAGGSFQSSTRINGGEEDWVYYSHRKSDVGCAHIEDSTASVSESSLVQSSKRSLLPWRKRKLSFRSPKAKGEPLLKKAYAEEGGDDIDFDRRQLSSDEAFPMGWQKTDDESAANRSSVSEFGDDSFAVGSWEHKDIVSRDGHMKLQAEVFFASIDQRSERAAGESACTALVAVIADWFQNNPDLMPIKSQFDCLIREGSSEWRNLCENERYRERFPDKHFDLETVLQAKVRPLSVVPRKSFIGFFHPEGVDEGDFEFLHGAMSFESIWDEISSAAEERLINGGPLVYIVSWNDHFFILKVEREAYYIIDTLGERLYEGCNQAYILKFGSNTVISNLPSAAGQPPDEKPTADQQMTAAGVEPENQDAQQATGNEGALSVVTSHVAPTSEGVEEVVCRGKEACKEYIKSFLAAIPIRELQADMKKGLLTSKPLHHRLQIEFHYTEFLQPQPIVASVEMLTGMSSSNDMVLTEVAA